MGNWWEIGGKLVEGFALTGTFVGGVTVVNVTQVEQGKTSSS
ncbi:hypothetical protein [Xenorhabdus littoralis]|nr:hypothetical protein [Xenorhabdus sp. Reich]